jgi:hypothetical protein
MIHSITPGTPFTSTINATIRSNLLAVFAGQIGGILMVEEKLSEKGGCHDYHREKSYLQPVRQQQR